MEVVMNRQAIPPAKASEVFVYLKQCALDMRTVEYGEVAGAVGLATQGLGPSLNYILDMCRSRELPWISAIAVLKAAQRPSIIFMPDERVRNWDMDDPDVRRDTESLWRGTVLRVFAYDWSGVVFG
jgi:hypothetical protein